MDTNNLVALVGIVSGFFLSVVSLIINLRAENRRREHDVKLRIEQQIREDNLRREHLDREDEIRTEKREFSPHIEFIIECKFFAANTEEHLAEITLVVRNKGSVLQKFTNIWIRVRGIEYATKLEFWEDHGKRIKFPIELISKDEGWLIPPTLNYYFVEPGVDQQFNYITKIPQNIKYISIYAYFEYDKYTPHTAEKLFEIH